MPLLLAFIIINLINTLLPRLLHQFCLLLVNSPFSHDILKTNCYLHRHWRWPCCEGNMMDTLRSIVKNFDVEAYIEDFRRLIDAPT